MKNLKNCKDIVNSYFYGLSNAQSDELVCNLQIALDKAISAVEENKKLKEENEELKQKIKNSEFEASYLENF